MLLRTLHPVLGLVEAPVPVAQIWLGLLVIWHLSFLMLQSQRTATAFH